MRSTLFRCDACGSTTEDWHEMFTVYTTKSANREQDVEEVSYLDFCKSCIPGVLLTPRPLPSIR